MNKLDDMAGLRASRGLLSKYFLGRNDPPLLLVMVACLLVASLVNC
jgi:hypothetical protein